MIKRQLYQWLTNQKNSPQIVQVQGLRQTGKTTLMDEFRKNFPDALHYPLQNLVILQRYRAEPQRWVLEIEQASARWEKKNVGPMQVFVDEIQKIPLLYQGIQGLYDAHKSKIKFWIWGSSARPAKRERAETLAGRVFTKILWPLSQSETDQHTSMIPYLESPRELLQYARPEPFDYSDFLVQLFSKSLLPEAYLCEDLNTAYSLLESYQSTYLENEIRRENLVRDIGIFQRFLMLASSEDTEIANYAAKAKVLGLSPLTVQNYYHILEDTFVVFLLSAYSRSIRVQISKSPKIYFTDSGLARFVAGKRGDLSPGTAPFGDAFESLVITEIKKQLEYQNLPWQLFYLRTKTNVEVDLIIKTPLLTIGCEIKAARKVDHRDVRPIQKLMKWDPSVQYGLVFSLDPHLEEIAPKIFNVPVWNL